MPETARLRAQPGSPAPGGDDGRHRWHLLALYAVFLCLALVPIAAFDLLPLADLPNHLARVHIVEELGRSPDLQRYYAVAWHVPSFQSIDFLMPPLASWIGLFPAARLYVAVTFLLLLSGTCALHRVLFGRVGWWPLISVLLLYNYLFAWGFVSYLFATGLVLLMFAAWIALRHAAVWTRLLVFVPATLFLLACHLFGLVAYGILVAVYELQRLRGEPAGGLNGVLRRVAVAAVQFLVPLALLLRAWTGSIPSVTYFGSVADITRGALSPFVMYLGWPELVILAATIAALLVYGRRRILRFSTAMRLPIAILLLLAAMTPVSLSSVWGANTRLPCLLGFLLVAASDLDLDTLRRRAGFVSLIAVLLLLRVGYVMETWQGFASDYTEYRQAAGGIAHGSRVLVFHPDTGLFPDSHVAAFSVIDRDVFLPHLFTLATPLVFVRDNRDIAANLQSKDHPVWSPLAPAFKAADAETIHQVEALAGIGRSNDSFLSAVDWSHWPEDFDYLVAYDASASRNPVPALLTEIAAGSFFTIYRIHPPAPGKATP